MNVSFLLSLWTVIAVVVFVGVTVWAWSGSRKHDFEKAARMALDDDLPVDEMSRRK